MHCIHVSKVYVSSIMFYCIVVHHLSVTNGSVGKHQNVDHFSVKILLCQSPLYQDVDHFSVKISKLRHYTEPLTSPVFIFNVTKAVFLDTFFTAKERISMLWGFSHIFSCQIFVLIIFCVITTLFGSLG